MRVQEVANRTVSLSDCQKIARISASQTIASVGNWQNKTGEPKLECKEGQIKQATIKQRREEWKIKQLKSRYIFINVFPSSKSLGNHQIIIKCM